MAKAKVRSKEALYDQDFFAWTQQQAAFLRQEAARGARTDLDLENLAEEIESLGKRDRRALISNVARIIEHLLKLQYSTAHDPRPNWETSVDVHRSKALKILADSPGLKSDLPDRLADSYDDGRRFATRTLRRELDPSMLPDTCPYTLEQILDRDWWP
jgi:hypothetical protein